MGIKELHKNLCSIYKCFHPVPPGSFFKNEINLLKAERGDNCIILPYTNWSMIWIHYNRKDEIKNITLSFRLKTRKNLYDLLKRKYDLRRASDGCSYKIPIANNSGIFFTIEKIIDDLINNFGMEGDSLFLKRSHD